MRHNGFRVWAFAALATMALLGGCTQTATKGTEATARSDTVRQFGVIKSDQDRREYRYVELPNGVRALLVSDPSAPKSAASLTVQTGSKDDPQSRPGLAHFLEHMLFLGTEKYPKAGGYQAYLAAHGGSHNAYTAFDQTTFFFDVESSSFQPALDRFAQFFIAPLLSPQYVEREMNAVNSEYTANIKSEIRRKYDALREVVNPQHPFSKFSIGNLQTLSDNTHSKVRSDLVKFYRSHYAADRMTLAVTGPQSLDELEKLVVDQFSVVPERKVDDGPVTAPLFKPGTLPAELLVTSDKDIHDLDLTFPLPDLRQWKTIQPVTFIADMLGHEGEGSLLQYLKHKGWADRLAAGTGFDYRGGATFDIDVGLTAKGMAHRDEVVRTIFQAIHRLRDSGINPRRYHEASEIAALQFRFADKSKPLAYVMSLSARMPEYKPAEVLRGPYRMTDYDPAVIRKVADLLSPANVLVTVQSRDLPHDRVSKWYHTPYSFRPVAPKLASSWRDSGLKPAIVVPAPNPFIPQDFSVKSVTAEHDARPVQLLSDRRLTLWYGRNQAFHAPKASIHVSLQTAGANDSATDAVLNDLYAALLDDSLDSKTYPATLAGFDVSVSGSRRGIELSVDGISDKQSELLGLVLHQMTHFKADPGRFADIRAQLVRRWRNASLQPPYRRLLTSLHKTLYDPFWDNEDRIKAAAGITPADVDAYGRRLLAQATARMLVYGNYRPDSAKAMANEVEQALGPAGKLAAKPSVGVLQLPRDQVVARQLHFGHSDSAAVLYLQGGNDSDHERALYGLTAQILRAPYFHSLRTQQQFGYIVFAAPMVLQRMPGTLFLVQSPGHGGAEIIGATTKFLDDYKSRAAAMTDNSFQANRQALLSEIENPPVSTSDAADQYWDQLLQGYTRFDRKPRLMNAVAGITLEQWQSFYKNQFAPMTGRVLVLDAPAVSRKPAPLPLKAQTIVHLQRFKSGRSMVRFP